MPISAGYRPRIERPKHPLRGEVGTCLRYFNVDTGGFLHVSFALISLFIQGTDNPGYWRGPMILADIAPGQHKISSMDFVMAQVTTTSNHC